ncbi:hypothetical protein NA57DRAFT_76697 [Rhizodiscina lignyota]|uniref:Uncharacterized protein n=1 Tax=Rhizodiscina lignyota TaxID=1504668 RepID=A0A9P4I9V2_9PEZI|nr:hypothetical protein NA57DRAFT_76697 [Rhizodiscina lignyota]
MEGPNIAAAVSAIIIAYQTSRDLMQSIRLLENYWRKHTDISIKEKLLSDALEAGENQVANSYATIYGELGEQYRTADRESQSKLFRIAQLIKIKITNNLQNAIKYDNAQLNYEKVTQDAILFRRAALGVLKELRSLFIPEQLVYEPTVPPMVEKAQELPVNVRTIAEYEQFADVEYAKNSVCSMDTPEPIGAISIEPDPAPSLQFSNPVDFSERSHPGRARLSRLFSKKRSSVQVSFPTAPASLTLLKHFDEHESELHADPQAKRKSKSPDKAWYSSDEVPVMLGLHGAREYRESTTLGAWDKWRTQRPATSQDHRPEGTPVDEPVRLDQPTPLRRQPSGSISDSSSSAARSDSNGASTPLTSPSSESGSTNWNYSPKSPLGDESPISDEAPAIPMKSPLRSMTYHQRNLTISTLDSSFLTQPTSTPPTSAPSVTSAPSIATVSSNSTSLSPSLLGRPTKKKNYWGFCKGAWAAREAVASGFKIQTRANGVYNTVSAWHCRQCSFQSDQLTKDTLKKSTKDKETMLDGKVYCAAGVLYRWAFLAKSHVKCKSALANGEYSYGCLFCCVAGRDTSVYGGVDTLMGHIVSEHAEDMARPDVLQRTNCVFGRVAHTHEDFDICVPAGPPGSSGRQFLPFKDQS